MSNAVPAAIVRGADLSEARIKKRYAEEARFRWYGLAAIALAVAMLIFLLGTIGAQGYSAFTQTH
ncbi:MAG: DUF3333 domain-containing protein, partial [Rhodospirillaceae bacterium]